MQKYWFVQIFFSMNEFNRGQNFDSINCHGGYAWSHSLDWELTGRSFTGLWVSGASACHTEPTPLFAMKLARA